jgi:microcystin-dependent protein
MSTTQLTLFVVLFVIAVPLVGAFIFTTINIYDKLEYIKSAYINKLLSINAVQGDGTSHNIQLFSNNSELSITSNPIAHTITLGYNNSLIEFRVTTLEQNLLLVEDLLNMTSMNGTGFFNMISTNFTTVDIRITYLESNITTIFGSLSLLNNNLTTILGSLSIINNEFASINGNITNILGSLSLIYTNLTTIESDISIINGNITNIQTQLDGKLSTINNVTGDANKNIRVVSANDNMIITEDQGTNTITFNVSESLMNLVTENGTAMPDMMGRIFIAGGSEGLVDVNISGANSLVIDATGAATALNHLDMMIMQLTSVVVSQNNTINTLDSRVTMLENFITNIFNFNISGNLNVSISNLIYNVTQLQAEVVSLQNQLNLINTNASAVPTGTIVPFGGATFGNITNVPVGYLACDGSIVSISNYTALWSVIGLAYCPGMMAAPDDFCLPDLRGKVPVGQDGSGSFSVRGMEYGEETHTLTTFETALPVHSHPIAKQSSLDTTQIRFEELAFGGSGGFGSCADISWCADSFGGCAAGSPKIPKCLSGSPPPNSHDIRTNAKIENLEAHSTSNNIALASPTPFNIIQPSLTVNYIIKY